MALAVKALFIAAAALIGYEAARATPPDPIVVTVSDESLRAGGGSAPRGAALPAPSTGQGTSQGAQTTPAAQVPCTSPAPDTTSTCVNGFWQAPATAGTGAARFDRENGCVTVQPVNDMVCRNGLWTLRGTEASVLATQAVTPDAAAGSPMAGGCFGLPPPAPASQSVACVSGQWVIR